MTRILQSVIKYANVFISLIIAITVFFTIAAVGIVIDPDFYSIFPQENKRVRELAAETGIDDSLEMHLYLSVEINGELSPEKLKVFYDVLDEITGDPHVVSCISPFNFITFRKNGGKLVVEKMTDRLPETMAETEVFMNRLLSEPLARGFVVGEDGKVLSALFVNDRTVDPGEFTEAFEQMIAPLGGPFRVMYSGDLPLAAKTTSYIARDLVLLLMLAIAVILIVLYLSFRSRRALMLPVITVGTGAIWAIGFSVLMGFKLTVVSVVLPTIVLAIGSSYSIHILSEYFRGFNVSAENTDPGFEICNSVSHVMKTVVLAGLTTMIGFCSLLFTSISPIREFGLSVSFGILSCVILSLFFLPSLMSKLPPPKPGHREKLSAGILNRIIKSVGHCVVRIYPVFILLFAAVVAAAVLLFPGINRKVDYIDYFPAEDQIVSDSYEIIRNSGGGQALNITMNAPPGEDRYFLRPDVMKKITEMQNELAENENVLNLMSFYTILDQINGVMFNREGIPDKPGLIMLLARYFKLIGENDITYAADAEFINSDYTQVTFFLKVYDSETGKMIADRDILFLVEEFENIIGRHIPADIDSYIWGNTVLFYEAGEQIQKDQLFATALAMGIVMIVSIIVFRSLVLGLFSLIPLVTAIALNYILMAVMNIPLDVTTVLVSNVAIGVGVDDAIHFLLQYRRQLNKGEENHTGLILQTYKVTGRPIVLTTVSIVAGFMMLCFASFKPIIYFGFLVSVSLTAAMISTLLFLPAFLMFTNRISS